MRGSRALGSGQALSSPSEQRALLSSRGRWAAPKEERVDCLSRAGGSDPLFLQ